MAVYGLIALIQKPVNLLEIEPKSNRARKRLITDLRNASNRLDSETDKAAIMVRIGELENLP